jgi:hypothetical protein
MPVKVATGTSSKKEKWIYPTTAWKTMRAPKRYDGKTFRVNRNFYVTSKSG